MTLDQARGYASPVEPWTLLLRRIAVGLFAVLATLQVVRTAAIAAWADVDPATVGVLWPGHPDVQRSKAMAEVGAAAAVLREPSPATLKRLERVASVAPLAVEPFLVRAAIVQRAGDYGRAEHLLLEARNRNPRSAAARFLLADLYLRTGRVTPGLAEFSVFSRLFPSAMQQFAPALAQYATTTGAPPQVKRIIRLYPELEPALLGQLATDTRNVDLILALATPRAIGESSPAWEQVLLNKLVEEGAYERAHFVWARLSRISAGVGRGLFNPNFRQNNAPPPFNWSLASGTSGVAEPSGDGIHVLYFGRDDVVLASQLMLLRPGHYRLEMNIAGQAGDGREIGWTVTCLPSNRQLMVLPIGGRAANRSVAGEFHVGGLDCGAQRLELRAVGKEFPASADFRIRELKLARSRG